jgi:hypothetical protein
LLTSQHPQIKVTMLYTFLWCLWKARNNSLFCRKVSWPSQIYAAANAIIKGTNLEDNNSTYLQGNENAQELKQTPHTISHTLQANSFTGNAIYCDAAWERQGGADKSRARIGVIIHMQDNQHLQQLHVSALSPPASSSATSATLNVLCSSR